MTDRKAADYKEIFNRVEAALYKTCEDQDQARAYLEERKHLEGRIFTDDEYYEKLVKVVFYAGFRAQTVDDKLPAILRHFPDYRAVARYDDVQERSIVDDDQMIRNRNKIRASIENAKMVRDLVAEYGSVQAYIDSHYPTHSDDDLKSLIDDLQPRLTGLGEINLYFFLMTAGMPVLKPDRVIKRIFTRLGFVRDNASNWDFVVVGRRFAEATGHPIRYVDAVFVFYGQVQTTKIGLDQGICLEESPRCWMCGATEYCSYYSQFSKAASA
jgi:DNA-3-methyladenine glycosylase I